MLAFAEHDRDLADVPAASPGAVGQLDLERVPLGVDAALDQLGSAAARRKARKPLVESVIGVPSIRRAYAFPALDRASRARLQLVTPPPET